MIHNERWEKKFVEVVFKSVKYGSVLGENKEEHLSEYLQVIIPAWSRLTKQFKDVSGQTYHLSTCRGRKAKSVLIVID